MKIYAAGVATETNTFAPIPTGLEDYTVQRGTDPRNDRNTSATFDLWAIWGEQARAHGHAFEFGLMAFAQPAGVTVRSAYESLRDELLQKLQAAMPVDIVLLMLHGAMVAEGYDDCEADIIRRVRAIVGPTVVIGVELDLHCHLQAATIDAADIVVIYKEYPHEDINARAREVFDLALAMKMGRIRPTMALFDCRMVGLYPTSRQPMRAFVDSMREAERRPRVLSVSFGHGFQFADLSFVGSKMLVVTDEDPALAAQVAAELGLRVYGLRREISFSGLSLPMEEALSRALRSQRHPIVVADQSDNVGGGAPGDATFVLRWLLERRVTDAATAILYDPEVVRIAKKAGVGATLSIRLGGKLGLSSGAPLDVHATVLALRDNYAHEFPQQSGAPVLFPLGDVAALRCGGVDVVVSSARCQCYSPGVFSDLGIDPRSKRLLIPKSVQHFYGAFAPIAGEVIYMAAPGAVAPDPRLVTYRRLDTSTLYPWVEDPLGIDRINTRSSE